MRELTNDTVSGAIWLINEMKFELLDKEDFNKKTVLDAQKQSQANEKNEHPANKDGLTITDAVDKIANSMQAIEQIVDQIDDAGVATLFEKACEMFHKDNVERTCRYSYDKDSNTLSLKIHKLKREDTEN